MKINQAEAVKMFSEITNALRVQFSIPVGPIRNCGIAEAEKIEKDAYWKFIAPFDSGYYGKSKKSFITI